MQHLTGQPVWDAVAGSAHHRQALKKIMKEVTAAPRQVLHMGDLRTNGGHEARLTAKPGAGMISLEAQGGFGN